MPVSSRATRFGFSTRRRQAVAQHLGAFTLAGLLLMLAFPRPGWGILAYVALVPAGIAAARTRSWRRLYLTGFAVFAVWWWWMTRWLTGVSPFGPLALGVWLGAWTALGVLAAGVLHQKSRWPMVAALPLGWLSVEILRSVWPAGGFSWFTLAHSQATWAPGDVHRVVQTADLFGQHTVGLVVAIVNGALVDLLLHRHLPRAPVGVAVLTLGGAVAYGSYRIAQTDEVAQPGPRVAVLQTTVQQDNTRPRSVDEILQDFRDLVELHQRAALASPRPVVIVWPETIVPFALNPEERQRNATAAPLKTQVAEAALGLVARDGVTTLVGSSTVLRDPEFARYNSAYLVAGDGRIVGRPYHKQHRVPAGEYIPGPGFVGSLVAWLSPWESSYELTPGDGPVNFTLPDGTRIASPICYEDAVAAICRRMVYGPEGKRVDALINLTNDGWYGGRGMRRQHAQLASLRCIENRVPMARSVNTGISTLIDPLGRSTQQLESFQTGVVAGELTTDPRATLYGSLGGIPAALFVLLAIGAVTFSAIFGRPTAKHRIA